MTDHSDSSPPPVLIATDQLRQRVDELAAEIDANIPTDAELVFVGVLTGAFVFLADLARAVSRPHRLEWVRVSSYDIENRAGSLKLDSLEPRDVADTHVVLVDDIIDRGRTLSFLTDWAAGLGARSVRSCTLLNKPSGREVEFAPDWTGFYVPDVWVVGYGMDSGGRYRSLPYIGTVEQAGG